MIVVDAHEQLKNNLKNTMERIVVYLRKIQSDFVDGKSSTCGKDMAKYMLEQGLIQTSVYLSVIEAINNPEADFEIKITE